MQFGRHWLSNRLRRYTINIILQFHNFEVREQNEIAYNLCQCFVLFTSYLLVFMHFLFAAIEFQCIKYVRKPVNFI